MQLIVDRADLKIDRRDMNCSLTRLDDFLPEVQAIIIAAGGATFWEYDRRNYNRILTPLQSNQTGHD